MPWYYAKDGQRFGPYTDAEFNGMVGQGTIASDTLVWRDGMADWAAFDQVGPQIADTSAAGTQGGAAYSADDRPMFVCSSCNRTFPEDEVIQYQGAYVCAQCKPYFIQQLREGARIASQLVFAGFWIRFAAIIIDGIVLAVVLLPLSLVFGLVVGVVAGSQPDPGQVEALILGLQLMINLFSYAVQCAYETFFLGRFGATPGKMAVGIKVVRPDGARLTYGRAFGRYWARLLSGLTLLIGFIIAAFDSEKRALHDHICGTRVVRA